MNKKLLLYKDTGDGGKVNFPYPDSNPLLIKDFTFTAPRMGIPTLSATIMYPESLDSYWSYKEFVEFRGERYWVYKKPTSSKNNTDHRYKYVVVFYSERNILNNVYFLDIVDESLDSGKYHSNSSNVYFFGDLNEFANRINASMEYSGISYRVVIDEDLKTENKEFSCENSFLFNSLNQAFETWDIPFYFKGKECHFGYYSADMIDYYDPLEYGIDYGLLKIERTNANSRVITRATGVGSSENIPFYYPNDSEKGNFNFALYDKYGQLKDDYEIIDKNKLACSVEDGVTYIYTGEVISYESQLKEAYVVTDSEDKIEVNLFEQPVSVSEQRDISHSIYIYFQTDGESQNIELNFQLSTNNGNIFTFGDVKTVLLQKPEKKKYEVEDANGNPQVVERTEWVNIKTWSGLSDGITHISTDISGGIPAGGYRFLLSDLNIQQYQPYGSYEYGLLSDSDKISITTNETGIEATHTNWWIPNKEGFKKISSLKEIGIDYNEEPPHLFNVDISGGNTGKDLGAKFTLNLIEGEKYVYQDRLMPSIFSRGAAFGGMVAVPEKGVYRFYDAVGSVYPDVDTGDYIDFENELNQFNRSENIYTYDDIKPTINNVINSDGKLICEVVDVAYDTNDNDETLGDEYGENSDNYAHPYFYIKLARTSIDKLPNSDTDYSFNLFNRATEKDSMTIQMTSGDCNGCKFKVQVVDKGNNTFVNPVQIYTQEDIDLSANTENPIPQSMLGQIKDGDKDKKISLSNIIPEQQKTKNAEVWIAVLKDQDTFGIIMPNKDGNHKVKKGDTFNITGIHLPDAYILSAEQELDRNIILDMKKDNVETFNHSIEFSRIFLQRDYDENGEHSWAKLLNETVRIPIGFAGVYHNQYVTSYTYECKADELLPKISVELANAMAKSEAFEDSIIKAATINAERGATRTIWNGVSNAGFATRGALSTKANTSDTLSGYGITDARIEEDGTIILGNSSVKPLTNTDKISSIAFNNVTNKPTTLSGYGITDAVNTKKQQTISGHKSFNDGINVNKTLEVVGDTIIEGGMDVRGETLFDNIATFKSLVTAENGINIGGDAVLTFDPINNCIVSNVGIVSESFISAKGISSDQNAILALEQRIVLLEQKLANINL